MSLFSQSGVMVLIIAFVLSARPRTLLSADEVSCANTPCSTSSSLNGHVYLKDASMPKIACAAVIRNLRSGVEVNTHPVTGAFTIRDVYIGDTLEINATSAPSCTEIVQITAGHIESNDIEIVVTGLRRPHILKASAYTGKE